MAEGNEIIIETDSLTKDYGFGRGVFDVSVSVPRGECFGFLGPNGAGKTTLIRHLMGFSNPDKGTAKIMGMNCFANAAKLQQTIGYLPGEIALPVGMKGTQFLKMLSRMRKVESDEYMKKLLEKFDLDPDMDTKRMSLGVKRKTAVVAAFIHDPDILILDEPTSGLDPIMQQQFIDFVLEEKQRGKTIFFSSHIFHEVDACCDRIAIIKDGRVVDTFRAEDLKNRKERIYRIAFNNPEDFAKFKELGYSITSENLEKLRIRITIDTDDMDKLIADISKFDLADFVEIAYTLEDHFMSFYRQDHNFGEVTK
ncbi:MAG: ABC transporter ATP-binding protein [Clostridia bacterium]|nr:ABC transporter ATP-binding protein [Clostridia bacterium]